MIIVSPQQSYKISLPRSKILYNKIYSLYGSFSSTQIYYSLTTTTSDLNVVKNLITQNGNDIDYYEVYTSGKYVVEDKNILYNSATGYDWGENNPGQTITSQSQNGGI